MSGPRSWPALRGRRGECDVLSGVVDAVHAGTCSALVLLGDAGIGKTALLEFLVERATGCRIARATGVESERELPYASLHQLCSPFLDRAAGLPDPQRNALGTAFGLRSGAPPDRFLLGLAVLSLLCAVSREEPLVCVVDDAQWLDRTSAQTLEFVARRLGDEPIAIVLAVRGTEEDPRWAGLPQLVLHGLAPGDAAALLAAAVPWPLDPPVRDRLLGESHGNPLALLELPRTLTATDLAMGDSGADDTGPPPSRLEQGFARRLELLPEESRALLRVAAAEPVGDATVLWRGARRLGIGPDAATAAEEAGLVELGDGVRFRHPLVRSAVTRSATPAQRRAAHRALAEVTDPVLDSGRQVWHRARAAVGTDETVAAELERAADRALADGALTAAAAFLAASAARTPDPAQRARRSLTAAQTTATAGAVTGASALLSTADAGPLDEVGRAHADLVRARLAAASDRRAEALPLLLGAARRLEPVDAELARATYLEVLSAAVASGRLATGPATGPAAGPAAGPRQAAELARRVPPSGSPGRTDQLLHALSVLFTDGYAAAAPLLRPAVAAFAGGHLTRDEVFAGAPLASLAAVDLGDDASWDLLSRRHLDGVRAAGAVGLLPTALAARALVELHSGDLTGAAAAVAEIRWVAEVTGGGSGAAAVPEVWLAVVQGGGQPAEQLLTVALDDAVSRGAGADLTAVLCARAVLCNGRGRYDEALAAAREAATDLVALGSVNRALAELVEAGVHTGDVTAAATAHELLSGRARASGTDWALGTAAVTGALLADDEAAERLHREGIDRLRRTRMRIDLARAQLRYGEWLRRRGRRVQARGQLRTAHDALSGMGVEAFADRVRRELVATGETVRRRSVDTAVDLTPQEDHIARLAAEGLTNPEIAVQLYLSPRTVEWHLRKVFTKRGVSTRRQLRRLLPDAPTN
jgi:DNA-binding CsgD family transcriptional regulator